MQKIIKHGHFPSTVPREVCCSGLHTWSTPVYCDLVKNKESDTFTTSLYTQHSHLRGLVLQPNAGFRWNLNSASMYFLTYFPHLWPGTKKAEGWFSSFPALHMFSCMTDITWLHLSIRPQRENRHASLNDIKNDVVVVQSLSHVMSDSLWPRGLQHARPPCPSPSPRVCSDSCPLSWWCHPIISSSVVPFSSHFHLSQHQGLLQWVRLFASGGQSIGVSALASVLPVNIQDWFP